MAEPHTAHPAMSPGSTPSFKNRTGHAAKVLVVDFGFLGDSVQLIPTLWELKRHLPKAQLHVLTTRVGGDVLRMAPCVDRIWDIELMPDRRTFREQLHVLRGLRREQFDAALNFSGSDRTVFWTWFSGACNRAAAAWGRHHFWTHWLIPDLVDPQDPDLPIVTQRRGVLSQLGFDSAALRYDLAPGPEAMQRAAEFVREDTLHLSINAAKPLKEWPLEHSIALVKQLLTELPALRIVASGSSREREQERLLLLRTQLDSPNLTLLPPDLTIPQLAAVLQRCRMHVGPDSGVMNLATAMGIPTVSFFRDQAGYKSWVPTGEQHHAFVGQCHCIDHCDAPCLPSGRADCLAAVTPEMALQVILPRLQLRPG